MRPFAWNAKRERAAFLVAEGDKTEEAIATELGIARQTLVNWKREPEFAARVAETVDALKQAVLTQGIADRVNRVRELDERWDRMRKVIEERATAAEMQQVPGGKTGLLVHQTKGIGQGNNFMVVDEYRVDDGLLRELRAHEEQAARELGQWIEKGEISGPGGAPIPVAIEEAIDRIYGSDHAADDSETAANDSDGTADDSSGKSG